MIADYQLLLSMKRVIIFFQIIVIAVSAHAQIGEVPSNAPYSLGNGTFRQFDNADTKIKGSRTFSEKFKPGEFFIKKSRYTELLNYDAKEDQVLMRKDTATDILILRKDLVEKFVIQDGNNAYSFVRLPWNGATAYFLEISTSDKLSFYCQIVKRIVKKSTGAGYGSVETRSEEYVTVNTYYVKKEGDNTLTEFKKNKKGLIECFPEDRKEEVSALLKDSKLDFNDYGKMLEILTVIND